MPNNNPYYYMNGLMGDPMGFIHSMIAYSEQIEIQRRNEAAGIQEANGFYGAPDKGIEFKYDMLDFDGKYFKGRADSLDHVFDKNGKFLFSASRYDYLKQGFFLVYKEEREERHGESYGALYKDDVKLTGYEFRGRFSSNFTKDSEFCLLGTKDYSECIVDKSGNIVMKPEKSYSSIYLNKNIAKNGSNYYNLFTGEVICKEVMSSTLETKEFLFVATFKDQVYKINKFTGEFELFGEPNKEPQTNDIKLCGHSDVKVKEVLPKLAKQNRNELCRCGSGLKVKKCNCNS